MFFYKSSKLINYLSCACKHSEDKSILDVSLIISLISIIISLIVALYQKKYNYDHLFAETITKNRMEWINVWRESLSIMLANADTLHEIQKNDNNKTKNIEEDSNKLSDESFKEFNKSKYMIISRLNMNEEAHILIMGAINNLDYLADDKIYNLQKEYILELARDILKPEWERLKKEAKGERK